MMRKLLILSFAFASLTASAQTATAGFEDFGLSPESFLNGDGLSGGFSDEGVLLRNDYNTEFMSWSGWAVSNTTDVSTPGFNNQYSAITGQGRASDTYAVSFVFGESIIRLEDDALPEGFYVTNSTYAYLSMLDGDAFAKKFGGLTGSDPDFFLLTVKGYQDGVLSEEGVEFYLADFTFSDNSQDYIVDEWEYVDISSMGEADSLSFTLTSSDVGEFGMNTPAYFCIDDFVTTAPLSTADVERLSVLVYPNPATDKILVSGEGLPNLIEVFDINGRLVLRQRSSAMIDVSGLESGNYLLKVFRRGSFSTTVFVKG